MNTTICPERAASKSRLIIAPFGPDPSEVKLARRSRKNYWRMSSNRIVQRAMTQCRLGGTKGPDIRTLWIKLHYGPKARV
jgi:hypothetical protein